MTTHADAVGLAAHDIPCTNLADSSATTIAELAQGKLAVLGAAQPPARPRRWKPGALSGSLPSSRSDTMPGGIATGTR